MMTASHEKELENSVFYDLVEIGKGNFGIVYKGLWKKNVNESKTVAVKVLKEEDALEELTQEAFLMAALDNEHIVKFFGIYTLDIHQETTKAIITEFMNEGSVEDFLKKTPTHFIPPMDIVSIALDAARGMHYLHQHNIIHRDLAAKNLLLTREQGKSVVKVSDFGLSRKVHREDDYYQVTLHANIPIKWTAPECFFKQEVSIRSDLWSFGVVLYELFTFCKKEPYEEWNNKAVMKRIQLREAMYQYLQIPDGPQGIQILLNSCMNNNSHQRPLFDSIISTLQSIQEREKNNNIWNTLNREEIAGYCASVEELIKTLKEDEKNDAENTTESGSSFSAALGSESHSFLPTEIKGMSGTYEILSTITLETARELQLQTGLVINFELGQERTEFIGNKGRFGQLRLGKDKTTGGYFGIKQITEVNKESLKEAPLQRRLNGLPHLMPLVDAVEVRDAEDHPHLYHIMPLAGLGDGKALSVYLSTLKDVHFKEALLIHVAKSILKGFQGLHQKNIAHLDFKPDNLVVDAKGTVFVIDFGCSLPLDKQGYITEKSLGSITYYSPERRTLSINFPGKPSDCYTIGLTLLELAVGMLPNKKTTSPAEYLNHPYLQNVLPGTYAALVKSLLALLPEERLTVESALSWPLLLPPTPPYLLDYLREFVQTVQWEKGTQELTSAQRLPLPHFTGYAERPVLEGKVLERLLKREAKATSVTACVGISGVGKTQLLIFIIHTPEVRATFRRIFWFRASESESNLNTQYQGLAQELKLVEEKASVEATKKAVIHWLENQTEPWLLVFDNADNPALLNSFLPAKGGSVLISSHSPEWNEVISVETLSVPEVQEMLFKLMPERITSREEAHLLGKTLGYLPFALRQAIAMLREENLTIQTYIERFKQKQQALLNTNTPLFGKQVSHSMVTLHQLQIQKLENECPEAIQLLYYSTLCAPDAIPAELFMEELLGDEVSPDIHWKAGQSLTRYALWQWQGTETFRVHRLMQTMVRLSLDEETLKKLFVNLANRITNYYVRETTALEHEQRLKILLPHLESLQTVGEKNKFLNMSSEFAIILSHLGSYYLYQSGQTETAKWLYQRALAIDENHYGSDHPETGITLTNLGNAYGSLGDYPQQKALLTRALAIFEKHYGPDHPETGITLTNLGNAYGSLGDYPQQKALLTRALAIDENHYGPDHPNTGITLKNLGNAYGSLGDYPQQKALLTRALVIKEKHYGSDHPNTGITLTNLGNAYGSLGDYPQQKALLTRALVIKEKHYGPDHPETGITLLNLGNVYGALGDYPQQKALLTRALAINEKHYGPAQPQTGITLTNLGNAYFELKDIQTAYLYQKRAYDIFLKFYGAQHHHTKHVFQQLQKLNVIEPKNLFFSNIKKLSVTTEQMVSIKTTDNSLESNTNHPILAANEINMNSSSPTTPQNLIFSRIASSVNTNSPGLANQFGTDERMQLEIATNASLESYQQEHGTFKNDSEREATLEQFREAWKKEAENKKKKTTQNLT